MKPQFYFNAKGNENGSIPDSAAATPCFITSPKRGGFAGSSDAFKVWASNGFQTGQLNLQNLEKSE